MNQMPKYDWLSLSHIIFAIQLVLIGILLFGDIGFDHPGRFGLDFDHFVILMICYVLALLIGLACSIAEKSWCSGLLQVIVPLAVLAYQFSPVPSYNSAEYQFLVGKPRAEVEDLLSSKDVLTGMEGKPDGNHEFVVYRGITLFYGVNGNVEKVVANDR